jgi:hypothetical protein
LIWISDPSGYVNAHVTVPIPAILKSFAIPPSLKFPDGTDNEPSKSVKSGVIAKEAPESNMIGFFLGSGAKVVKAHALRNALNAAVAGVGIGSLIDAASCDPDCCCIKFDTLHVSRTAQFTTVRLTQML